MSKIRRSKVTDYAALTYLTFKFKTLYQYVNTPNQKKKPEKVYRPFSGSRQAQELTRLYKSKIMTNNVMSRFPEFDHIVLGSIV